LADRAGAERELEVAARDARRFRMEIPGLKRRRARARNLIGKTVGKKKVLALPAELRTLAEYFGRQPRGVRLSWAKVRRKLRSVRAGSAGSEDYHRLRIALKRARYALELRDRGGRSLKEIQDLLGRAHDLEVLERLAGETPAVRRARKRYERRAREKLPRILAAAENSLRHSGS
jgi:CHAD domain-containing protein